MKCLLPFDRDEAADMFSKGLRLIEIRIAIFYIFCILLHIFSFLTNSYCSELFLALAFLFEQRYQAHFCLVCFLKDPVDLTEAFLQS